MTQTPTIGRIVHYTSRGSADGRYKPETRAAIITEVGTGTALEADGPREFIAASLCILNPTGMFFDQGVEYSEEPKPGCWSWPPRT